MSSLARSAWLLLLAGTLVLPATLAFAQEDEADALSESDEGEGAEDDEDIGGSRFDAWLRAEGFYTNNFYYAPKHVHEEEASGTVIRPFVNLLSETRRVRISTTLTGEYGVFDVPGNADDYLDGQANTSLAWQAGTRDRISLRGGFEHGHDGYGTNRTEASPGTLPDDLDRFNEVSAGVRYHFGAPGATLNTEVGISGLDKHYITNQAATSVLNYRVNSADYSIFYRIAPKTSALLDLSRSEIEVDNAIGPVDRRSGDSYHVRGGLRWLATGKTSGDVRVGISRRDFDSNDRSVEGINWQAGLHWTATAKSTVKLRTARNEQQSYVADANARVIDNRQHVLEWEQNWTVRTNTSFLLERTTSRHVGIGRRDEIRVAGVVLSYLLHSNVSLVARTSIRDRDSNFTQREYDKFDAYLGLRLDL